MATKNKVFLNALLDVGLEKGISPDILFDAVEAALVSAYKRNFNTSTTNVRVYLDRKTGEYRVYSQKKVVEEVENPVTEISLQEAHKINEDYVVDDIVEIEVTPANFGRIAAQTAKQVVVQRIREAERGIIFDEFSGRANDIMTGIVQRVEGNNVYINLGKTEAILLPSEQIPNETYRHNQRLKVYIVEVKRTTKGPQVVVSRTHPGLLRRLFEYEVPEIAEGIVQIKSVAREPGTRSKIAVYSTSPDVDAVGSCVGPKYMRVQAVIDSLNGEKVDIVEWSEDPAIYIANALSPAKVTSVVVDEASRFSRVVVPDYQLSLAIGKEGQNARLAAKLTTWKVDIKSESQAEAINLEDNQNEADANVIAEIE